MKSFTALTVLLLGIFIFTGEVRAETRYVTDQLIITLRQGKGNEYKIIKTLKTGTPLEIIEDGDTYLYVRTKEGETGYVLTQYVTKKLPGAVIISQLTKERDQLQATLDSLQSRNRELKDEYTSVADEKDAAISTLAAQRQELSQTLESTEKALKAATEKSNDLFEQSKNVIEITEERDHLRGLAEKQTSEVHLLQLENSKLRKSGMIKWFLAGGSVFFIGWISGKVSRRKRSHW